MIGDSLQLAQLFLDIYNKRGSENRALVSLQESIHRELQLNAELVKEVNLLDPSDRALASALLRNMRVRNFEAMSTVGLPLREIFPEAWKAEDQKNLKYRNKFRGITQTHELVERAYHRIYIQKLRCEVGQVKGGQALGYLELLSRYASQASRPRN